MITDKMAHVIMGAINVADSEGISGCRNIFKGSDEIHENELFVVRMLYNLHPQVVRHENYAGIDSVKEVLKEYDSNKTVPAAESTGSSGT